MSQYGTKKIPNALSQSAATKKIPDTMSQSQDGTFFPDSMSQSDCTKKIPDVMSLSQDGTFFPGAMSQSDCTKKIPDVMSQSQDGTFFPDSMSQSDCTKKTPDVMSQSQDGTFFPGAMSQSEATKKIPEAITKYGQLILLGANGEETERYFTLSKRREANGWKPSDIHNDDNQSVSMDDQHKMTFTTPINTVVVALIRDKHTDMFQIGRKTANTESHIDFPVTDTVAQSHGKSVISRYACRIICQRNPPYTAHIYAAGFDSTNNIFLGEEAVKWQTEDGQMDGLTTNGVRVKRATGPWWEISVRGHAFAPRENGKRGIRVDGYDPQELMDGSVIDLCGVTLLWRTAEGLAELF